MTQKEITIISEFKKIASLSEKRLKSALIPLSIMELSKDDIKKIELKIEAIYKKLYDTARSKTSKFMSVSTAGATVTALSRVKNLKSVVLKKSISQLKKNITKRTEKASLQLASTTTDDIIAGLNTGKAYWKNKVRRTKQRLVSEDALNKILELDIEQGGIYTRKTIKRRLGKSLVKELNSPSAIVINAKRYKLDSYIETVMRSRSAEIHSISRVQSAHELGTDLIQVSSHNADDILCAQYEGKIFSITGEDKRFPIITAYPPYHPNCTHSVEIVFESVLQSSGRLKKEIDFSNGKSAVPPRNTGYVPLKDRKLQ